MVNNIFGEFNEKLHVNRTIRFRNKTKMEDFFIIQVPNGKYF